MDKRNYLVILYDFYGELLNDKQKECFEDYYFNNLSLGEISENENVSRNAIHKSIKSIENKLYFYEEKLKLYQKSQELNTLVDTLQYKELKVVPGNFAQMANGLGSRIILAATDVFNKNRNCQGIAAFTDNNTTIIDNSANSAGFVISFGTFR